MTRRQFLRMVTPEKPHNRKPENSTWTNLASNEPCRVGRAERSRLLDYPCFPFTMLVWAVPRQFLARFSGPYFLAEWRFCCPVGSIAVSCSPVEHEFTCPYCGEEISMVLDLSVGRQTYIEDCEVCCKPIEVSFTVEDDELASFSAKTLG
jgi:hypothetical protein